MQPPEIPDEEQRRLKSLRALDVLDTPAEERFDRLTRMAKRLFDVPIALVSLVDENRQWFKSHDGLDVSETPRDVSFCGHAILSDEIFLIPDTHQDERFVDNPLVTDEPYIRSYAGCPLRYVDGSRLGTLCIIDTEPRTFSDEDLESLQDLALTAENELSAIQMAWIDDLTGLHNRRGFNAIAQHGLDLCVRQKIPATLVFLDLDDFKSINDTHGHSEGDQVLKLFSRELMAICRGSDIAARLGGDEFVLLLLGTDESTIDQIMERLRTTIDSSSTTDEPAFDFSYGKIHFDPARHDSIDMLMDEADRMMYDDKRRKGARHSNKGRD